MQLAVGAPLVGAVLAGMQYFDTHIWQAVVLSYIGAPFIGAYIIVMAPLLLQLLPRAGGLGERLGVLLSPFNLCSVLLAYIAAVVIDSTGNYRLIWLFPAATGLAHAAVNCWLKFPPKRASSPDMVKRLWEWSIVQAESMAETGIVTGLLAAPLLGVVTKEDADSAVVIDMARNILGNPYAGDEDASPTRAPALEEGRHTPPGSSPDRTKEGQSESEGDGGSRRVTGVTQVGGGPDGGLGFNDQKSGRGDSSCTASETPVGEESKGSATDGPAVPACGAGATVGPPEGGVASVRSTGQAGASEAGGSDGSEAGAAGTDGSEAGAAGTDGSEAGAAGTDPPAG
jgi:hypothetical protein